MQQHRKLSAEALFLKGELSPSVALPARTGPCGTKSGFPLDSLGLANTAGAVLLPVLILMDSCAVSGVASGAGECKAGGRLSAPGLKETSLPSRGISVGPTGLQPELGGWGYVENEGDLTSVLPGTFLYTELFMAQSKRRKCALRSEQATSGQWLAPASSTLEQL